MHMHLIFSILCLLEYSSRAEIGAQRGIDPSLAISGQCKNTFSGRWHLADDTGRICPREDFDYSSGCCKAEAPQHSCDSCGPDDQCCLRYEHCVSCCLSPTNHPEERLKQVPRGFKTPETGYWETPFEYCRAACRTTSRSTQHENAFIADRRFCFSSEGRPLTPVPPAPPLPPTVKVVSASQGKSCELACQEEQRVCNPAHFDAVNDCNSLRKAFACEAGCGPSQPHQTEFPGYVANGVAKHLWPAFCFTRTFEAGIIESSKYNCTYSVKEVSRLCPCEEGAGLESQAEQGELLTTETGGVVEREDGSSSSGKPEEEDSWEDKEGGSAAVGDANKVENLEENPLN